MEDEIALVARTAQAYTSTFAFDNLPLEIQLRIFGYLVVARKPDGTHMFDNPRGKLLSVNKSMYSSLAPLWYQKAVFAFGLYPEEDENGKLSRYSDDINHLIAKASPLLLSNVRHVQFRFGKPGRDSCTDLTWFGHQQPFLNTLDSLTHSLCILPELRALKEVVFTFILAWDDASTRRCRIRLNEYSRSMVEGSQIGGWVRLASILTFGIGASLGDQLGMRFHQRDLEIFARAFLITGNEEEAVIIRRGQTLPTKVNSVRMSTFELIASV